jgi:hypothetical protein
MASKKEAKAECRFRPWSGDPARCIAWYEPDGTCMRPESGLAKCPTEGRNPYPNEEDSFE